MKTFIVLPSIMFLCLIAIGCSPQEPTAHTPVLLPGETGSWDSAAVACPSVLYDTFQGTEQYIMYYAGTNETTDATYSIGYATSSDGIQWEKPDNNCCLDTTGAQDWYADGIYGCTVLKENSNWHMWFKAYKRTSTTIIGTIGYASSSDGITWTINSTPALEPSGIADSFDETSITDICVFYDSGTYHIWYTGEAYAIGYTTTNNPAVIPRATTPITYQDDSNVESLRATSVLFDTAQNKYLIWATASSIQSMYVLRSSEHDTEWECTSSPVLTPNSIGFDSIQTGLCSIRISTSLPLQKYQMWYTGWDKNTSAIGYAESNDGIYWKPYSEEE